MSRHVGLVGALVACAVGGAVTSVTAAAAAAAPTPCWQRLISDWADGHIDGRYRPSCYRTAIANAPTDLRIYSTLVDDLQAALQIRTASVSRDREARRTLALARPTLARPTQTAGSASSTLTRLVALFAVLGGGLAAALLAVAVGRRRLHHLERQRSRR
jgi:hypothetical protein